MTKEKEHILWIVLAIVVIAAMVLIVWMSNIIPSPSISDQPSSIQNSTEVNNITTNSSPESSVADDSELGTDSANDAFVEFEEAPVILTNEELEKQNAEDFPELPPFPDNTYPLKS